MPKEWTEVEYKRFGAIIGDVLSGVASRRQRGYNAFYAYRREWEIDRSRHVFEGYLARLEEFRVERKFPRIAQILGTIRDELVTEGRAQEQVPSADLTPAPWDLDRPKEQCKTEGDQLSLFG